MRTADQSSTIRLIIADDHKLFREGLRALLGGEGDIEVLADARDGEEAVLLARTLTPDMMLIDVGMPGVDGTVATRLIKALNENINILVLSNFEDEKIIAAAMQAGADAYVMKRIGVDDLLMVLYAIRDGESFISPYVAAVRPRHDRSDDESRLVHDFGLTDRERTILGLLVQGYSNKEISNTIFVSLDTVKVHLKHIFEKLQVDSRTKAAVKTIRHNILPFPETNPSEALTPRRQSRAYTNGDSRSQHSRPPA